MSVVLFRCDDRLIHGQCIVRVINDGKINKIILVDVRQFGAKYLAGGNPVW